MRMLTEEFKRTWLVVKVIFIAFGVLVAIAALPLALLVGFVVFISGLIYRASSGRDAENAEKMRGGVDQSSQQARQAN